MSNLDDILNGAGEDLDIVPYEDPYDFDDGPSDERLQYRRAIAISSGLMKDHVKHTGEIWVNTGMTEEMAEERGVEVVDEYYEELPFMLIDQLYSKGKHPDNEPWVKNGSRRMYHSDSQVKELLCSSPNGLTPFSTYVGDDLEWEKDGKIVKGKIGYTTNEVTGEHVPIEDGMICVKCPFAQWHEGVSGKKFMPCNETFSYMIWTPEHGLIRFDAKNRSVHAAMLGTRAGKWGSRADGSGYPGIARFFRPEPKSKWLEEEYDLENVTEEHVPFVSAINTGTDKKPVWVEAPEIFNDFVITTPEEAKGKKIGVIEFGRKDRRAVDFGGFFEYVQENAKGIKISVRTFPYAPKGLPDGQKGLDERPVYRVVMFTSENDSKQNTIFAPDFKVSDTPYTQAEWDDYLETRQEYHEMDGREQLMNFSLIESNRDRLMRNQIHVATVQPAQLPDGSEAEENVEEGGSVVDAEFDVIDDDDL